MRIILLPLMLFGSLGCSTIVRTTLPFNDLPAPSGPYTVATEIETWKDNSRLEAFTENPSDIRRIFSIGIAASYQLNQIPILILINPTRG